ncbi:hypothetical protein BTVI_62578 [Pitangus sulphuratus]|nr:hypothetical protein BTVI_62578 [Pitangus sulphuratus]
MSLQGNCNTILILRKAKEEDPRSYRLISLTSVPLKVLKKLNLKLIFKHINETVIRSSQQEFTKRNTYLTNLMNFCGEMSVLADEDEAIDIIYLNFIKIFHTVSFKIFIDELIKLGGVIDGHATTQRYANRLEKWADGNLMNFNKEQCKVLQQGRNTTRHKYMLEATKLESNFKEKDLGVMVGTSLNRNQP